jgi:hypothetical protein
VSEGAGSALVCGFADPAGAVAGLCWRLDGVAAGVLLAGDAAIPAEAELGEGDGGLELKLSAGGAGCQATLLPRPAPVDLNGPDGSPVGISGAICAAAVEFEHEGKGRSLSCAGHLTRWQGDPLEDSDILRHLSVPLADDGVVLVVARRPAGSREHGEEETGAWRLDEEGGAEALAEALLSTQYDDGGGQTRAGLELWPAGGEGETLPLRAAGTRIGGAEANGVSAVFLNTSSEGRTGIGSYLIRRR